MLAVAPGSSKGGLLYNIPFKKIVDQVESKALARICDNDEDNLPTLPTIQEEKDEVTDVECGKLATVAPTHTYTLPRTTSSNPPPPSSLPWHYYGGGRRYGTVQYTLGYTAQSKTLILLMYPNFVCLCVCLYLSVHIISSCICVCACECGRGKVMWRHEKNKIYYYY